MSNIATVMKKYMTVKQWVTAFGYIPEGGIRHLIFTNEGFKKKVVRKVGKKILLDVEALDSWINEQQTN